MLSHPVGRDHYDLSSAGKARLFTPDRGKGEDVMAKHDFTIYPVEDSPCEMYEVCDRDGMQVACISVRNGVLTIECGQIGGGLISKIHVVGKNRLTDAERPAVLEFARIEIDLYYGHIHEGYGEGNLEFTDVSSLPLEDRTYGMICNLRRFFHNHGICSLSKKTIWKLHKALMQDAMIPARQAQKKRSQEEWLPF